MKQITLIILAAAFLSVGVYQKEEERPNVIIFIADDISWDDFGCYGNKDVQTPNIDQLAANGLKFTNTYLTTSSCSPSRNSIITGRYPHNTGAAELHTEPPIWMVSFPELLRANGYYSALAGKFHMGEYARRGFNVIYEGKENGDGGEDMWLQSLQERPKDKPFFMWFAPYDAHREWGPNEFSGTHNPEEITVPFYLADGKETKEDLAKYYDEIKRFDYFIGKVTDELREQGVLNNTLIIVMSDNGRPFPASKTRLNDRGVKTPFIIHWPEKIKSNSISNSLISAVDIAPTILKLTGTEISDQFQGHSFDILFPNPAGEFRNYVFAEHNWHDYEAHERMIASKDYLYILNSRPSVPQTGPLDAVGSPTFKELVMLKDSGKLSAIQADIFVVPRPHEELYDNNKDSLQLVNVASVPEYNEALNEYREILSEWMQVTGDNIPENLTQNWYLREPGEQKTKHHGIRGEMPGSKTNATRNNNKGRF